MTQQILESSKSDKPNNHIRRHILHQGSHLMVLVCRGSLFIAFVVLIWDLIFPNRQETVPLAEAAIQTIAATRPTPTVIQGGSLWSSKTQWRTGVSIPPRVGLISGHAGYDSGAVCPDGLTEVEINRVVTLEVANLLNQRGVQINLLEEVDNRLYGYRADALVSIHADSCTVPGVTGFKVVRSAQSGIPQIEDHLVSCIENEYGKFTLLPVHANSVTHDMLHYHAFRKVAIDTPAAIIELGFMLEDRYLLERRPKQLAQGITAGIMCFLETEIQESAPKEKGVSEKEGGL